MVLDSKMKKPAYRKDLVKFEMSAS